MRRDLFASEAATVASVKAGFSAMPDEMRMSGSTTAWLVCDTRHALGGMVAEAIGAEGQGSANAAASNSASWECFCCIPIVLCHAARRTL